MWETRAVSEPPIEVGPLAGQGPEYERLLAAAATRRMPHSLVIEGAAGTGKSTAARELAGHLLGGEAGNAHARVVSGNHPDLHLCTVPDDRVEIPVDAVRELIDLLQRSPVEGGCRVAIVDPADQLNEQGQNALLKTLEEPGEDAFLLLVARRPEGLLETVRSRSGRIRIRPLDDATLLRRLTAEGVVDPAERARVTALAGGSLGLARRLLDPAQAQLAAAVDAFLQAPAPSAVRSASDALMSGSTGRAANTDRARSVLLALRGRLRKALHELLAPPMDAEYGSARAESCLTALDAVLDAESDLDLGIPASQVVDGLLLSLVGAFGVGPHSV